MDDAFMQMIEGRTPAGSERARHRSDDHAFMRDRLEQSGGESFLYDPAQKLTDARDAHLAAQESVANLQRQRSLFGNGTGPTSQFGVTDQTLQLAIDRLSAAGAELARITEAANLQGDGGNPAMMTALDNVTPLNITRQAGTAPMRRGPRFPGPVRRPQDLASLGRDGDNIVAHINPEEAEMLKRAGGRGTINPATGLPEFATTGKGDKAASAGAGAGHGTGSGGSGGANTGGPGSAGAQKGGRQSGGTLGGGVQGRSSGGASLGSSSIDKSAARGAPAKQSNMEGRAAPAPGLAPVSENVATQTENEPGLGIGAMETVGTVAGAALAGPLGAQAGGIIGGVLDGIFGTDDIGSRSVTSLRDDRYGGMSATDGGTGIAQGGSAGRSPIEAREAARNRLRNRRPLVPAAPAPTAPTVPTPGPTTPQSPLDAITTANPLMRLPSSVYRGTYAPNF